MFIEESTTEPKIITQLGWEVQSLYGQCDGACSLSLPSSSGKVGKPAALFSCHSGIRSLSINNEWRVLFVPSGIGIAVVNQMAHHVFRHFKTPRSLNAVPAEWRERWGDSLDRILQDYSDLHFLTDAENLKASFDHDTLVAWLHVTNACNLSCSYCYLEKTNEMMQEQVGQQAISAIFRSALANDFSRIKLKFAGGEPTLNLELVLKLQEQARVMAKSFGLALDSTLLSNGVSLSLSRLRAISKHDLRLMISLDQIGESHKGQRVFANGDDSFVQVSASIEQAIAAGLTPHISITVSNRNISTVADTVAWVIERGLPFHINFYRENTRSASFQDLRLHPEKTIRGMQEVLRIIEANLPDRSLLGSLLDNARLTLPHQYACGAGHNYLVIDHFGRVSKCQMQIEHVITDIYAIDPLSVIRATETGVQNHLVDTKEGCSDCEWRYWCGGGCSLTTYRSTGRYDVKSPNCEIFKALFPEIIRLEGLRLLSTCV